MRMCLSMIWVLTALAMGALAVGAEEPPAAPTADADGVPPLLRAPESGDPGFVAGLRAYIDPVTGELVAHPSPAQERDLARAIAEHRLQQGIDYGTDWDTEGLFPFVLPDGGTGVDLRGRFLTSTVVRVGPGGELHFDCTHDPEGALTAPPGAPETSKTGSALK